MLQETHRSRCRAHNSRTGEPCGHWPIRGGTVCHVHGGKAPQVKKAAEERLRDMVDPALNRLLDLIDHADTDSVRLAAVKDVLDRAGYAVKQQFEITIRQQAEMLALQLGVDADELIAEAERLVASAG